MRSVTSKSSQHSGHFSSSSSSSLPEERLPRRSTRPMVYAAALRTIPPWLRSRLPCRRRLLTTNQARPLSLLPLSPRSPGSGSDDHDRACGLESVVLCLVKARRHTQMGKDRALLLTTAKGHHSQYRRQQGSITTSLSRVAAAADSALANQQAAAPTNESTDTKRAKPRQRRPGKGEGSCGKGKRETRTGRSAPRKCASSKPRLGSWCVRIAH